MTKEVSPPVRVQKRKKLLFLKFQTVNHEEVWALPSVKMIAIQCKRYTHFVIYYSKSKIKSLLNKIIRISKLLSNDTVIL